MIGMSGSPVAFGEFATFSGSRLFYWDLLPQSFIHGGDVAIRTAWAFQSFEDGFRFYG